MNPTSFASAISSAMECIYELCLEGAFILEGDIKICGHMSRVHRMYVVCGHAVWNRKKEV